MKRTSRLVFRGRRPASLAGSVALAAIACSSAGAHGTDTADASAVGVQPESGPVVESPQVRDRLRELRARFQVSVVSVAPPSQSGSAKVAATAARRSLPVIGPGVAERFEWTPDRRVRAVLPAALRHAVLRSATTTLPLRADGAAHVEDDATRVAIDVRLRGALDVGVAVGEGIARYAGVLEGADWIHRVHAEGSEDFVVFEQRPASEEIDYEVDVGQVAGLRLVSNVLEFLDETGTPRLRVGRPWIASSDGAQREATLALEGCAADTDPRAPWGRKVTRPGARSCVVKVRWTGDEVRYPAILDPNWTATGSMTTAREYHTATLLSSGNVLMTGGQNAGGNATSTAELFDGIGSFAATGYMTSPRQSHSATALSSGRILIAGGLGGGVLSTAELFDGLGVFAATGPMTSSRTNHSATLLPSGEVLLAGGFATLAVSTAELFDGWNTFTATGSMKVARYSHSATLLPSGKVLIAAGYQSEWVGSLASAELFDGKSSFASAGSLLTPRWGHSATLLGSGKVLFAGGWQDSAFSTQTLSSAELFDGTSGFSAVGSMAQARGGHTGTLLGSGLVLIAGGFFEDGLSSAELFDGTSTFSGTGSLTRVRHDHTATLLKSGKVLVAGGEGPSGSLVSLATSELYAQLPVGATCSIPGECASGICDQRCCAGACNGICQQCDATGACIAVTGADDPDTCTSTKTCSASGACLFRAGTLTPGASMCASGLAVDGICCAGPCSDPSRTCAAGSGACLLKSGQPATVASTCASGFVADGVCCNTACTDVCARCDAPAGVCSNTVGAPVGGRGPCPGPSAGTCGAQCDGKRTNQCSFPSTATACSANACASANETHASFCDGAGRCKDVPRACAPYVCDATACKTSCVSPVDCAAGNTCVSGVCVALSKLGDACTDASRCPAGTFCTDGVCCGEASCGSGAVCNTSGKPGSCAKTKATTCTSASECESGFCVDGVCCDRACTEQCAACDLAGSVGTCAPVAGEQPHGARTPCSAGGGDVCAARRCDGKDTTTCAAFASPATSCSPKTCNAGVLAQPSKCDGKGACKPPSTRSCAPYACADATDCASSCTTKSDCSDGFTCVEGSCVAIAATCSDDGAESVPNDGSAATKCAPFRCDGTTGRCFDACVTGDECASGAACADGRCQAAASTSSSGGCSTSPVAGTVAVPVLALLGALALRSRRAGR
jgi:hypothetical protein